ncbi:hypothetical protein Btru_039292 [Bulinus truncatus]|nr:hypothetical protein Btru_039292 [Bulinus truncatus]
MNEDAAAVRAVRLRGARFLQPVQLHHYCIESDHVCGRSSVSKSGDIADEGAGGRVAVVAWGGGLCRVCLEV